MTSPYPTKTQNKMGIAFLNLRNLWYWHWFGLSSGNGLPRPGSI